MGHPNFNQLLHFWAVVREGSVVAAAREQHVTPQTISGQIKLLEQRLKGRLLERQGRRVVPTEFGLAVYRYADEIFATGQELMRAVEGGDPAHWRTVTVGVSDVVPNLIAWRAMAPLLQGPDPFRVTCHTGGLDTLVAELAAHRLDLVLSTSALATDSGYRAFSHYLGECDVAFFAPPRLAPRLKRGFPQSLDDAPFLVPTERSPNRRVLDNWFAQLGITPRIVGEFDDSALIKTFGQGGAGVFAAPAVIAREITLQNRVRLIGATAMVHAKFYALSMERRIRHPAVVRLLEATRDGLFVAAGARRADGRAGAGAAGP